MCKCQCKCSCREPHQSVRAKVQAALSRVELLDSLLLLEILTRRVTSETRKAIKHPDSLAVKCSASSSKPLPKAVKEIILAFQAA